MLPSGADNEGPEPLEIRALLQGRPSKYWSRTILEVNGSPWTSCRGQISSIASRNGYRGARSLVTFNAQSGQR